MACSVDRTIDKENVQGLHIKLNNGLLMPRIGLGTVMDTETPDEFQESILSALKIGYRHIDTASLYGSESCVGNALQQAFRDGLLKREDVFVTTKVWVDKNSPAEIICELNKSLKSLQLNYVDCYMVHMPVRVKNGVNFYAVKDEEYLPFDLKGSWEAMEHLLDLGLTKSIGVSNFYVKILQELLLNAKVVPAINQVELHPFCQQTKLRAYCDKMGIHVSGWCPLGAPNVSSYGTNDVLDNPTLKQMAAKHGKSVPQISLRWALDIGCSSVPKSSKTNHQKENLSIFDFHLTDEDHAKFSELPQRKLFTDPEKCRGPYRVFEVLWDDDEK